MVRAWFSHVVYLIRQLDWAGHTSKIIVHNACVWWLYIPNHYEWWLQQYLMDYFWTFQQGAKFDGTDDITTLIVINCSSSILVISDSEAYMRDPIMDQSTNDYTSGSKFISPLDRIGRRFAKQILISLQVHSTTWWPQSTKILRSTIRTEITKNFATVISSIQSNIPFHYSAAMQLRRTSNRESKQSNCADDKNSTLNDSILPLWTLNTMQMQWSLPATEYKCKIAGTSICKCKSDAIAKAVYFIYELNCDIRKGSRKCSARAHTHTDTLHENDFVGQIAVYKLYKCKMRLLESVLQFVWMLCTMERKNIL